MYKCCMQHLYIWNLKVTDIMKFFTKHLLDWFAENKRTFPWRSSQDPYEIWVSEIMSQQTQIDRVAMKYYPRFIERFPSVKDLALASWEEVFPVWEGLGDYRRGQNMLKAAQVIQDQYSGVFPRDITSLRALPGIGDYTAAAILSFAFDAKHAAIDTNVTKIIQTLWPDQGVEQVAQKLIAQSPSGRDWNSAMMDLASSLRAGNPVTDPLKKYFPPKKANLFLPVRKTSKRSIKKTKRLIQVGIACIWDKSGNYLIQSRPKGKSFVGYWEFPGGKRERGEDFRSCVKREVEEELGVKVSVRPHFYEELCRFKDANLLLRFHRCQIQAGNPMPLENQNIQWVHPNNFDDVKFLKTNGRALVKLRAFK